MTYKEAGQLYRKYYGKVVQTCWIADVLRSHGKTRHKAWNRIGEKPMKPCPEDVRPKLERVLKELRMI